jgi:hypothetical protein
VLCTGLEGGLCGGPRSNFQAIVEFSKQQLTEACTAKPVSSWVILPCPTQPQKRLPKPVQLTFQIHQCCWLPLSYGGKLVGEQHACKHAWTSKCQLGVLWYHGYMMLMSITPSQTHPLGTVSDDVETPCLTCHMQVCDGLFQAVREV